MDIIESSFAVASFLVIALPGLVYSAIRRWARGERPEDRDFGLSVARGAVFAVTLTGIYLLVFGNSLGVGLAPGADTDAFVVKDARALALTVLGLYVVLPGMIALVLNHRHLTWQSIGNSRWIRYLRSRHGYSDAPTAWDYAARKCQSSWVKVRKSNGDWIGGWFTKGSYASTYPEPKSIYIDQQYRMTSDGNFGEEIPGTSVFLTVSDDDVVIWVKDQPSGPEMGASNE